MGVAAEAGVVVWQRSVSVRAGIVAGHVVVFSLFLFAGIAQRSPTALVLDGLLGLLLAWNATMVRPSARLERDRLVLQGRFTRRIVDLGDLKQVALTLSQYAWVETRHPIDGHGTTVLKLGMIPWRKTSVGPTASEAVPAIRQRALAAGAKLDPRPTKGTRAPLTWRGTFFGR
jgi:hypothetical protein